MVRRDRSGDGVGRGADQNSARRRSRHKVHSNGLSQYRDCTGRIKL